MKTANSLLFFLIFALFFSACRKQEPAISPEQARELLAAQEIAITPEAVLTYMIADRSETVGLLLLAGVQPDAVVMEAPLLVWAASMGKTEFARLLLKHGARVNIRDKGVSPLMVAAMEGHENMVLELLAHNANVDLQNENGMTALMSAAHGGHHEIVRLLLRRGANPELEMLHGITAEDLAESEGHLQTALLLREHRTAVF